jgi:hypothetical protein
MKRVFALFVGVSVAIGALVIANSAGAVGPPLSQYVVYGENGVVIGNGSTVIGLVGARNNLGLAAVTLEGGSSVVSDPAHSIVGDVRTAGNTRMLNSTTIQGTLLHSPGTTVTKTVTSTIGAEVVGNPELPTLPPPTPLTCPTGGPDSSGANGVTKTVGPGTYGNWNFGANITFNFTSPGTYKFNSIHTANGVTINAVPGVKLLVCDSFQLGAGVSVLPTTLQPGDFTVEVHGNDTHNAFRLGGNPAWIGNVYTPNGGIHIGSGGSNGSVKGQLVAGGQVDLEHSLTVTGGGGGGGGGGADKDATLNHAAKNENNGANKSLRVKYQEDSVIGFDVTGKPAHANSAIIELTICNTPGDLTTCPLPSSGWPAGGGHDTATRLDDGWERWGSGIPGTNTPVEGNGNNFPIVNNPRGDHSGVTWNCAIDTNIANEAQDCSNADGNFWNAGLNFDDTLTSDSTELLTNNMPNGTKIHFDVTAMYNKGMGPLDHTFMSFFIRKLANSGSGFAEYWSIQGAALVNPSFAPKLILT